MSCWYGNLKLLKDIFKSSKFKQELIDEPDYVKNKYKFDFLYFILEWRACSCYSMCIG